MRKYILWDHDGVLVDTEKWYFEATRRVLAGFGIALDRDTYVDIASRGASYFDLAAEAGAAQAAIEAARAERDRLYLGFLGSESTEVEGVVPVLEELSRSYRMAVVTTSRRMYIDAIHRERRITRFMDFILTLEDYPRQKPNGDPYLAALARFAAQPAEAVVVEDSVQGLRAATAAGIACIVLGNSFTAFSDLSGAAAVVEGIREVPGTIASL